MGEKGDSLLFLQPAEIDYLKDLEKHGVTLIEYPLLKLLSSFPSYNMKHQASKFVSIEMHPLLIALQRALESFVSAQVCCYCGIDVHLKTGVTCFCSVYFNAYENLGSVLYLVQIKRGNACSTCLSE